MPQTKALGLFFDLSIALLGLFPTVFAAELDIWKKGDSCKIRKNLKNWARTKIHNYLQKNLQTRKPEVGNGSKHPQALSMHERVEKKL